MSKRDWAHAATGVFWWTTLAVIIAKWGVLPSLVAAALLIASFAAGYTIARMKG